MFTLVLPISKPKLITGDEVPATPEKQPSKLYVDAALSVIVLLNLERNISQPGSVTVLISQSSK